MDASPPRRLPVIAFCFGHMAVDWPHGAIWILAPALAVAMNLSPGELGTLFAVTAVGSTVTHIPAGMITDHFGRRGLLFVTTFIWVVLGYGAATLAPDFWSLTFMLALAGMGTSAWHPLATGTLTQAMPGQRARILGIHAMGGTLAEVFAPLLTGVLLTFVDWRTGLGLSIVPAVIMGAVFFVMRDRMNVPGPTGASMLDMKDLWQRWSSRTGLALVAMISIYNMAIMAVLAMATLYLVNDLGLTTTVAGFAFAAMILAGALLQPLMGHLSDRRGRRKVFAASLLAVAPLGIAMPFIANPVIAVAFLVAMIGAFYGVRSVVLASAVDFAGKREGTTLGLTFVMMDGIGALGALLGGFAGDFDLTWAFVLASGFAIVSATIAILSSLAFPVIAPERRT